MAKYGEPNTTTGQAFRTKVVEFDSTAMELPIVSAQDILLAAHPVNIHANSGKQLGSIVLVEGANPNQWYIAMATGSAPTDKWKYAQMVVSINPT